MIMYYILQLAGNTSQIQNLEIRDGQERADERLTILFLFSPLFAKFLVKSQDFCLNQHFLIQYLLITHHMPGTYLNTLTPKLKCKPQYN